MKSLFARSFLPSSSSWSQCGLMKILGFLISAKSQNQELSLKKSQQDFLFFPHNVIYGSV